MRYLPLWSDNAADKNGAHGNPAQHWKIICIDRRVGFVYTWFCHRKKLDKTPRIDSAKKIIQTPQLFLSWNV
jgi:hypothetical protein